MSTVFQFPNERPTDLEAPKVICSSYSPAGQPNSGDLSAVLSKIVLESRDLVANEFGKVVKLDLSFTGAGR